MQYPRLLTIGIVIAVLILAGALVLVSRSGGDDKGAPSATPAGTGAVTTPTAGGATPAGSSGATPTAGAGGQELPLDVPEAGGVVSLAAGDYRTARFQPQAFFSLSEGWSAAFDTARFVDLFRGGDVDANCVCLINPDGVIEENGAAAQPLPGGGTVDGLIDWLTGNASLQTSNPSSLQVGDLSGRQLDIEVAPGASGEVEYLSAGSQRFKVKAGERQHLTVLDYRGAPLVIAQRSPAADYSDYFTFVEQVVGSLTFTN